MTTIIIIIIIIIITIIIVILSQLPLVFIIIIMQNQQGADSLHSSAVRRCAAPVKAYTIDRQCCAANNRVPHA